MSFLDLPPRIIQQMELEKTVVSKEEHRSHPVWCERCGKVHYHPFPPDVLREGLFKERISALVAYMKAVDHASFSTIRKFIRDVLEDVPSRQDAKGKEQKREAFNMAKRFRENGKAYFEFILAAVRAYFRGDPAPSLLPALG